MCEAVLDTSWIQSECVINQRLESNEYREQFIVWTCPDCRVLYPRQHEHMLPYPHRSSTSIMIIHRTRTAS
jgi:hypothetical protein